MEKFLSLNISIFIISDSRNERSDKSGKILEERIEESGHKLVEKIFIEDDEKLIFKNLKKLSFSELYKWSPSFDPTHRLPASSIIKSCIIELASAVSSYIL